ncbi:MAG TPA: TetR family transcriptional regulator [Flavisolibacter sp.]|nr:TetR family transcriptional regulator [Flavisolibacter sp.]
MALTEKQIHIIRIAEKLFAEKGFNGTSVRDIAEAAGVNIAMISYYFGSKEKLMQALFEERTSGIVGRVETLLKVESLTPFQKIEILIDDYIERLVEKQQFYKIMLHEQMFENNPVISTLLSEQRQRNAGIIEKLIKEGQEKGAFKKGIDIVFLMNTMVGIGQQTFINQNLYRHYNNLEALNQEAFYDLLKKKLSKHIKVVFKSILSYEA